MNEQAAAETSIQPDDERFPATKVLLLSWLALYAAMTYCQGRLQAVPGNWLSGGIDPGIANLFGSLSSAAIADGQYQRTFTATFIHFSLIHLGINSFVMYRIGRFIETDYGSGSFLFVCLLIGVGANLAASLLRPLVHQSVVAQSGGGSGLICGLITLVAVSGWRENSRSGDYLLAQMGVQLLIIGAMGLFIKNVDNLVHAAGAVVGAVVGLADLFWLRARKWKLAPAMIAVCLLAAAASAWAQVRSNRADYARLASLAARDDQLRKLVPRLQVAEGLVLQLASISAPPTVASFVDSVVRIGRDRAILNGTLQQIDALESATGVLASDPRVPVGAWRTVAEQAMRRRPYPNEVATLRKLQPLVLGLVEQACWINYREHLALCARMSIRSLLNTPPLQRAAIPEPRAATTASPPHAASTNPASP